MPDLSLTERAEQIIARCRELARITDVPGETTRLFLSPATRDAHTLLSWWMRQAGLPARTDSIGNLRATRAGSTPDAPTFVIYSHIDTVPNAGPFDGPLGVILGLEAIAALGDEPLPFGIELVAFSEEEGVRFAFPFLSSRAAVQQLDPADLARTDADGTTVEQALRDFGLDPAGIVTTTPFPANTFGALEVHIEQGPVLEAEDKPLAVVDSIVGQSRLKLSFEGHANHAGTTPMPLRHDALAAAAQFIVDVESYALNYKQLVATVGRIEALPGAMNVVPGAAHLTLDIRHPKDESRHAAVAHLLTRAQAAGEHRGVEVRAQLLSEQKAVPMDSLATEALHDAAVRAGYAPLSLFSGAGHDSMIIAPHVRTTMLFVRSPGGLSHHPDETVIPGDVEAALATVIEFLRNLRP